MNGKKEKIFSYVLAGAIAAGIFTLGFFTHVWITPKDSRKVDELLTYIEDNFYGEFDMDEFLKAGVTGSLGAYSAYYTKEEYAVSEDEREGLSRGKIGLSFSGNSAVIVSVAGNSPAEHAGIEVGGKIVAITYKGQRTAVNNYAEFNAVYSETEEGEDITLEILYGEEVLSYTVKRENYEESYIRYSSLSGDYIFEKDGKNWKLVKKQKSPESHIIEGFSYIKLLRFYGDAAGQLEIALDKMKQEGNKKLILDLRGNGGGDMQVLSEVASLVTAGRGKRLIAKAVYKNGNEGRFYATGNKYSGYNFESITVLADQSTASASEALIGAMLDYDKENGNIVRVIVSGTDGEGTTFGKGIMQTTFALPSGGAVKLTTAEVHWPISDICIHGKGVSPAIDGRVSVVNKSSTTDAELNAAMGI